LHKTYCGVEVVNVIGYTSNLIAFEKRKKFELNVLEIIR